MRKPSLDQPTVPYPKLLVFPPGSHPPRQNILLLCRGRSVTLGPTTSQLPNHAYPDWFIGGSYNYGLMCWRDLDVYVLDPQHDLRKCFDVAYEVTQRLSARKSRFTNNIGSDPDGFYWGIKLGDERRGAWKIDLWFLDGRGYKKHANYCDALRERLTPEKTSAILEIKEAYWRHREYRDTITSDLIYRAVLDHNVTTLQAFESFVAKGTLK